MLIFFIHGVATRNIKYADPLKAAIKQQLLDRNQEPPTFYSCFWGNALSDVEKMWNWIDQDLRSLQQEDSKADINDWFRYRELREGFLSEFIGDMFTYLHPRRGIEIRRLIAQQLVQFIKDNPQDKDLHIIAHSLGTVILWDILFSDRFAKGDPALFIRALIQNLGDEIKPIQVHLKTITTMGSPILFFNTMLGTNPNNVKEFAKRNERKGLKWLNIIQSSDLIAYPLKSMFALDKTDKLEVVDEYIKSSNLFSTIGNVIGLPIDAGASHSKYWECEEAVSLIIGHIQNERNKTSEKSNLERAIDFLRSIPGMTIDELRLNLSKELVKEINFSDGSGKICYLVNATKIHHIQVFDQNGTCCFAGYVGWIHTQYLKNAIDKIQEFWC